MNNKYTELCEYDKKHIWHPYTSMSDPLPSYPVERADGSTLTLATGEKLIDGMSSWWAVIHGYNHPVLNAAITEQVAKVSHVMFGGITHQPAIELSKKLIELTPKPLTKVFLSDSGSVAVEVAIKMAFQYWQSKKQSLSEVPDNNYKSKLLTVRNGYHGDTFATMSVCDPVNGMHTLFDNVLNKHFFAPAPKTGFGEEWQESDVSEITELLDKNHEKIAALIIEPVVQGAGGMRIYHPNYLKACRELCDQYDVLLIVDEIATGFGRTGKMFASEWADISADILCVGKALTGGYMSLAATLCTDTIATTISDGAAGCFMHGPTFMGNPLACSVANASLGLLMSGDWHQNVMNIEAQLLAELLPLKTHVNVEDVRVIGAIGVVEAKNPVNMQVIQQRFVELGVWIRPFGKLIYIMPTYISSKAEISSLVAAIKTVLSEKNCFNLSA